MKNIYQLFIIIVAFHVISCKKNIEGVGIDGKTTITANGIAFTPEGQYNTLNLYGSSTIQFNISANTGETPLECYFSIEDPWKSGTERTIIKTNPAPIMIWNRSRKIMQLQYVLNVDILSSGRDYIGHIVINGDNIGLHQQTDYTVRR